MPRNLPISQSDLAELVQNVDIQDRKAATDAIYEANWLNYFKLVPKGQRLNCFSVLNNYLIDEEYFRILGWVRVNGEKGHIQHFVIADIFATKDRSLAARKSIMEVDELIVYEALPEMVIVFRGQGDKNSLFGWSWTQYRAIALKFATMFANGNGFIRQGKCQKLKVIAFKHGPEDEGQPEDELIIDPNDVIGTKDEEINEE